MDTKKVLAAVSLLAMVATPVFAMYGGGHHHRSSSDVDVDNENCALVINNVEVEAETGDNEIEARGGLIVTGDAIATGLVDNIVNTNETYVRVPCRGCEGDVDVENDNGAFVMNDVEVEAETGDNEIEAGRQHHHGGCFQGCGGYEDCCPTIRTGDADSLASVVNVVNTNITRIRR